MERKEHIQEALMSTYHMGIPAIVKALTDIDKGYNITRKVSTSDIDNGLSYFDMCPHELHLEHLRNEVNKQYRNLKRLNGRHLGKWLFSIFVPIQDAPKVSAMCLELSKLLDVDCLLCIQSSYNRIGKNKKNHKVALEWEPVLALLDEELKESLDSKIKSLRSKYNNPL